MKNLDLIAEELFNKVRGRFPSVTIGNAEGQVTNKPNEARFFDFDYKEGDTDLGKVSINLTEESIEVMYSDNFVGEQDELTKTKWYDFLKELRQFSKKRLMKFDTRNINKSNLDRRDYQFLAANRGDNTMSESKLYGTSKLSYQNIDSARIVIKHNENVNPELGVSRTRNIGRIYIENSSGERFLYPYKHLTGARAMARHVAEGGKPYDDFGTHIVGLSEELNKLRKFKSYMGRSAVMAESLSDYMDVVRERISTVKKTIMSLQKPKFYAETLASYEKPIMEEVPSDVAENWIDQLTIKQFNEELKDVFPYIYNLVSEAKKAKELGPDEMLEGPIDFIKNKYADMKKGREKNMAQYKQDLHILRTVLGSHGYDDATIKKVEDGCLNDPRVCLYNLIRKNNADTGDMDMEVTRIGKELNSGFTTMMGTVDEQRIEDAFESMMGQFAEDKSEEFKPHMMYDPKTGKGKMANKEQDHLDLSKKGWTHDKPKDVKEGKEQLPVSEFVLSLFNREDGTFPKGETAVLTAIEKDYGEQYIEPAKEFIESIKAKYEEFYTPQQPMIDEEPQGTVMEPTIQQDEETAGDDPFGDEIIGTHMSQKASYDPDFKGPKGSLGGYGNEADAIEDLMSKPALTSAESNWLHMAYIKHGILKVVNGKITRTDKDLGQALDDIRSKVKNKAMKSVASHDKAQAAYMAQPDDDEEMDEDLRMNKRGKIEYDVDYSDLPNELEDDFSMAKLKKEYEKAVKNKTTKEAQDIMRLAGL